MLTENYESFGATIMNWFTSRSSEVVQNSNGSPETTGGGSVEQAVCQNLINCYNTEEDCPAPWDRGVLFPDDVVGEIRMQILDPAGLFFREDPVELKEVFRSLWSNSHRRQKVLIRGRAGFGKTTLCNRIVLEWRKNCGVLSDLSCGMVLLIYFRLRTLTNDHDLETELLKFLIGSCGSGHFSSDIHRILSSDFRSVLLLDGYNEASLKHQRQVRDLLGNQTSSPFQGSSVIVTSRPEVDQDFLVLFDKHFILNGLSSAAADVLVRKYYHNSDSVVTFMMSKFQDILQENKMSPLLLVMLCYLQRHNYDGTLETFEQVVYQCSLEITRRTSEPRSLANKALELRLYDLGKNFLGCLHDRRFLYTRGEIQNILPDSVASALFRSVKYTRGRQKLLEVIHPCIMEVLAMNYIQEFWYSLQTTSSLISFVPCFSQFFNTLEIYAYKECDEVCFKMIAEIVDVGNAIWDIKGDSCIFSTCLDKSLVPRKMGHCKLNINFTLKLSTKKSFFLNVLEKLFSNSASLTRLSYLVSNLDSAFLQVNFLINDDNQLCESVPLLYATNDTSPWTELRDMSTDINLTFLGKGCNHKDVVSVLKSLLNLNLKFDKETTQATELLNALKTCSEENFICTLASVAKLRYYYLVDTRRRFAFEDLRPWTKKKFFQPKYNWGSVDMLVLDYKRNEQPHFVDSDLRGCQESANFVEMLDKPSLPNQRQ